jgi:hypothetical protein
LVVSSGPVPGRRWLLLIHQLPPKPDYFRVKIWRRLQRIGAVAIKNSVYVLPRTDQSAEHFQWILREVEASGGEASVCEAAFVTGLSDGQIEALFRTAREADYAALSEEARELLRTTAARAGDPPGRAELEAALARLRRRLAEIGAMDFFGAPARQIAEAALERLEARMKPAEHRSEASTKRGSSRRKLARTWVTRRGVHVDRIASAWLIRRFIDPRARFRFVEDSAYQPQSGEMRFDMFEAEYTHEGDRCTFETLMAHFGLDQPGLQALAEMVHDIDLADGKFARPETPGFQRLIDGITRAHTDDDERIAHGAGLLDDFFRSFQNEAAPKKRRRARSR